MPLLPGSSVGPYKVVSRLGAGGMGEVFLAQDARLNRPVAIKLIAGRIDNDSARRRFQREIEATSSLNHPHIVTVYDVVELDGGLCLVTELVDGGTLTEWSHAERRTPREIAELLAGVAEGLAAAHAAGILHRDIKPANILVAKNGYAKVADFGLAKSADAAVGEDAATRTIGPTQQGAIVGTIAYMSPEQASGRTMDARSDVFSLGVVLYELMAGRRPFGGATDLEILQTVINSPARPLPEEVPADIRSVVEKALEKNPAERYQSASDLAVDLRRVARQSPPSVATTAVGQRQGTMARVAAALLALFVASGVGWWWTRPSSGAVAPVAASQIRSIAVLPLDNLSGDPEQEYFSDGTTEELIAALAQMPQIRVISRTSVMRYKGPNKPTIPEIGRALGVDAVIEGSVRRAEGRVRVTAQLIHAASDTHLWARNFDRDVADVLIVQGDVARAVVQELQVALSPDVDRRLASAPRVNPMAWDETLLGHSYRWKGGPDNDKQAIARYQRALELQPDFAPAYAGIALALQDMNSPDTTTRRMAARRAVELDPNLAEAHAAVGGTNILDWNWDEGYKEFRRAIEINPNSLDACGCFIVVLSSMGRFDEAIAIGKRLTETNPLASLSYQQYGAALYHARRFDEAEAQLQQGLQLEPDAPVVRILLSQVYEATGRHQDALNVLDRPALRNSGSRGLALAVTGQRAEALRIAEAITRAPVGSQRRAASMIYFALGDKDRGFEWLAKSLDAHEGLAQMLIEVPFDNVRTDPRFLEQLARFKMPADAVAAIRSIR